MSNAYFENYPLVNYKGVVTRNIISRARFIQSVIKNYFAFYPFVISDGQTWEQIADAYYGDPDLDWVCFYSNNVFDPYYSFPMDQGTFDKYIQKNYGDFETAVNTVHHYTYNSVYPVSQDPNLSYTDGYELSPVTYSFFTEVQKSFWRPVSVYEWESDKNEARRTIQLLDRRLLPQLLQEINKVMK